MKFRLPFFFFLEITSASAQIQPNKEQIQFFESKIQPVLSDSCYECHSKEAGQKKGGLSLDTRFGLRLGGNSGPGVVSGILEESWIWLAISHTEPDYEMPPKSKLPYEVLADFKTWIEMGAPDPRESEKEVVTGINIEEGKKFWSFQTPRRKTPPMVSDPAWSRTAIDQFVYAKLELKGLEPAKPPTADAILRRLCFDLIGIPPTIEFANRFRQAWNQNPGQAIETAADRLLQSQQFGERWGKHWLDVARYAESNGKGANQTFPNAWRYRDYVIDSINADKPIDRFITEQLAGDLLPNESDEGRQENLIATGFLAIGPKNLREKNSRQFTMDMVDEQIDATSTALLGLTVSCARCHDHKTDPIPTHDYYALAGIFLSSDTHYGTDGIGGRFNQGGLIELPLAGESDGTYTSEDVAKLEADLDEVRKGLRKHAADKRAKMQGDSEGRQRSSAKKLRATQSKLEETLTSITGAGNVLAFAMGMTEKDEVTDTAILVRGEIDSPAQAVPRGFLQVLDQSAVAVEKGSSGRLEMAGWIASNRNPLTARVFVNRVWEKIFGQGLVASVDNFGTTGQGPSHPELLDHLAIQFMEDGWSLKKLVKTLVLTRTYFASTEFDSANYAIDPDNRFLWRAAPKRLDAESFRDSILATTQAAALRAPVPFAGCRAQPRRARAQGKPERPLRLPAVSLRLPASHPRRDAGDDQNCFEGADPELVTGFAQGFPMGQSNHFFLMKQPVSSSKQSPGRFAELLEERSDQFDEQVRYAFHQAYGRPPSQGEYDSAIRFHRDFVGKEREAGREFLTLFLSGTALQRRISLSQLSKLITNHYGSPHHTPTGAQIHRQWILLARFLLRSRPARRRPPKA